MAVNGFSTCPQNYAEVIGSFKVPGTERSLTVRREIAPLLIGLAADFHQLVEPITIDPYDDWGYACRYIRGSTNNVSLHAAGIAIDLNATRHPLGARGTFNARQRATIAQLCRKYGVRWGGDFTRRPDEMHFEVALPRDKALALVEQIQAPPKAAVGPVRPRLSHLANGAHNSDVVLLQKALVRKGYDIGTDGIYGPQTARAVQAFQKAQGWTGTDADGQMGPETFRRLFA